MNPFQQGIEYLDPRDVPLVYAGGVTRVTEEIMATFKVEPNGRPCTTMTLAALKLIAFEPFPIAEKISIVLMFSIEALAGVMASAQTQIDSWDDETKTRYLWLLDQCSAAANEANQAGPGDEQ